MSLPNDDGSDPLSPTDYQRLMASQRRPLRPGGSLPMGIVAAALLAGISLLFGLGQKLPLLLMLAFALFAGSYGFIFFGVPSGRELLATTRLKIAYVAVFVVLLFFTLLSVR